MEARRSSAVMTSNRTLLLFLVPLVIVVGRDVVSAAPQSPPQTIWSGVFGAAQAKRGEAISGRRCATWNNADLAGGQERTAMVGAAVLRAWSGTTPGDLF